MSLEEIEPRVKALESVNNQNQIVLTEIKNDFHHMSKTVGMIERTLAKFSELFIKVERFEGNLKRVNQRLDKVEVKVKTVGSDFYECRGSKLSKDDFKQVADKISAIELAAARNAWVNRMAWLILTPLVNAVVLGVVGFFIFGGAK